MSWQHFSRLLVVLGTLAVDSRGTHANRHGENSLTPDAVTTNVDVNTTSFVDTNHSLAKNDRSGGVNFDIFASTGKTDPTLSDVTVDFASRDLYVNRTLADVQNDARFGELPLVELKTPPEALNGMEVKHVSSKQGL